MVLSINNKKNFLQTILRFIEMHLNEKGESLVIYHNHILPKTSAQPMIFLSVFVALIIMRWLALLL